MHILTLNCGSSSVKYQLFDHRRGRVLARGLVERIGEPEAALTSELEALVTSLPLLGWSDALRWTAALNAGRPFGDFGLASPRWPDPSPGAASRGRSPGECERRRPPG